MIRWPASEVCRLSLWGPRVWRAEDEAVDEAPADETGDGDGDAF